MSPNFFRDGTIARGEFEEQLDLGQVAAEIIVNVAGDSRAFLIQCSLLFQCLEFLAQSAQGNIASGGKNGGGKGGENAEPEPPGLPDKLSDREIDGCSHLIPDAVTIACLDAETVVACRNSGITG